MFIDNPLANLKCYWLCFEWNFEWFRIGITDRSQMNDNLNGMEYLLLT